MTDKQSDRPLKTLHALPPADISEIHQLYAKYCFAVDVGDGDLRAQTFTDDGTFASYTSGHKPEPASALRDRTNAKGNHGHRHINSNIILEPTDDGVLGKCSILVMGRIDQDGGSNSYDCVGNGFTFKTGFFDDFIVKTADGWRFKTREIFLDFEPESPFASSAVKKKG